jgi:hypothetical protein
VEFLFILGIVAARRGGFSLRWTSVTAVVNAAPGLLTDTAELKLHRPPEADRARPSSVYRRSWFNPNRGF